MWLCLPPSSTYIKFQPPLPVGPLGSFLGIKSSHALRARNFQVLLYIIAIIVF